VTAPVLTLRGVKRTYVTGVGRPLEVLKGVDLEVYPGEIVGLIGPSGSGKSSLLHAAGLLEHPTEGRVSVTGVDASSLNDRARSRLRLSTIGFVYQFHHLLAEFSALDNVALPQMIAGARPGPARERAASLLTQLGLGERLEHQPAQLLLADEPTGNLDPATSGAVFQSLFDLARIEGVAALVATHNLHLASFMDRVFAIEGGRLEKRAAEAAALV
jgi:lipoprotein-releasing system ATP-binding protein